MVTSFSLPGKLKRTISSNHLQSSSCELLRLLLANMLTKVFALSFILQADSTLVFNFLHVAKSWPASLAKGLRGSMN